MRLVATKASATTTYNGLGDQLYDLGGARPSLDLNFAHNKNLNDSLTGSNLVDFTRASSGTYVDSEGVIRTATTNRIWPSEDFSTTWILAGVSVTSDAVDNPYGDQTADTLTTTATAFARVVQSKTINSNTFVLSIYAKAGTSLYLAGTVELNPSFSQVLRLFADLSTGVTTQSTGNGTISATSGSEQLDNGWWRFYWIITTPTTGSYDIYWAVSDQASGFGVAVGKTLHLWGAQLEQSSTVGEYIPTTSTINSAPRFDHDPTTGESLGLLVEEQRTNLLVRSQEFDNASWVKTRSTVTANATVAPDGTLTADRLVEDSTATSTHLLAQAGTLISIVGSRYTYSVYAKADGRNWIVLSPGSTWGYAWFNVSTGALGTVVDGGAGTTASITNVGNGWYRCAVSATAVDARGLQILLANVNSGVAYTGDGTSGVYLWGAQLEAGAFPTSYIPTTTATATRAADVASISGSNFSSWYRQDEGTMFVEAAAIGRTASSPLVQFQDASATDRIQFRQNASATDLAFQVVDGASASSGLAATAFQLNAFYKGAIATKTSDHAATINSGTISASSTPSTMPTVDQLRFNTTSPVLSGSHLVRRLTYWPARLPNETLQTITV